MAGPPAAVNAWVKAREAARGPGDRVETGDDLNPQLKLALDRAQRFLAVSLVLTLALAAVAIGMAARQHAERHRAIAATLRALGAGQRAIVGLYVGQLALLGAVAILLALAAALLAQQLAGLWVARALGTALPAASAWPLLKGGLVGLWILATFALPPLLALRRVSALAVLRQDLRTPSPPALLLFALALGGLLALFWQAAGNAATGAVLLGGLLATAAVLGLAGWALAALVARAGRAGSGIVRYALLNLSRRRRLTIAQVVALGLSLMALLLLLLVRTDVWDQWQASVRADAPNRFVINVQPDQRAAFDAVLARLGLRPASFSPLIRARYVGPSAQQRGRPAPQGAARSCWTASSTSPPPLPCPPATPCAPARSGTRRPRAMNSRWRPSSPSSCAGGWATPWRSTSPAGASQAASPACVTCAGKASPRTSSCWPRRTWRAICRPPTSPRSRCRWATPGWRWRWRRRCRMRT
ncbi:hypothetical protein LJB71_03285 [Thermomonas sp. S9]|uniref:ABC transporter permease n=1 Tax=Thermomonas sp. S9 TaxID=2885203 RepID=UPI00216B3E4E|nr:FtsX-like permease family protein [Thermomonas sp. S9]MCR6495355.1 hypothetical protein [Thermomonas sp. S9]